jgi:presqualene diphosphate synthase
MTTPLPSPDPGQPAPSAPKAAGSSFYAGMRVLPKAQREAMYAVYDFCRAVDDIADEGGPRPVRRAELRRWRADIDTLYAGHGAAPRLNALFGPIHRYGLAREDFHAIIDGMDMDAADDIRAPDWATLDLYCDRVASAVGRLSVLIFGMPEAEGRLTAHHLGRALQLTNILRDIDEDAGIGRLYLPRESLAAAGITATEPEAVLADVRIGRVCDEVAARARSHFAEAHDAMRRCPRRTTRSPRLMGAVYRTILDRTVARGWAPPRPRVKLSKPQLAWAILRHGLL